MSVRPSVCPSVRPSVHKKFLRFQWNLVCMYRSISDAWVWPDPRSRSQGLESQKFSHFQRLFPPPLIMGAGKWPRILKLGHNTYGLSWPDFLFLPYFVCHLTSSTKSFFDFNEICYVGTGRWLMHDGMQCDSIQGQGHEPLKVSNSAIFKGYLFPYI